MTQQINLLNPIFRKQPVKIMSAAGLAVGIGIIIVLTGLYGIYEMASLSQIEAQARTVAKQLADARAQLDPTTTAAKKPDAALEATLVELASQLKTRQDVLEALKHGSVGSTTGFSEFLRAFSRQRVEGVWLIGFDITGGGADLTIAGRALSADLVPTYLQRLNKEPPMQGRRFGSVSINRPAARGAAKDGDKDVAVAVLPPYLEFVLASAPAGERRAAETADTRSLAWRGPLEAEMRGEKAKAGP